MQQFLIGFLYFIEIIVCFLMGAVILLQKPKDGGLGVSFGGGMGEALFGAQMGNVLTRTTIVLGVVFLLNTLVLSRLTSHGGHSVMEGVRTPAPAAQQQSLPLTPPSAPAAPAAPASVPPAPVAPAAK